ncbi:neuropeptide y receptor type, partial [Plakobranchus ocellatus]
TMSALATIDVFVSTLTIVAIAVDRYMSIVHMSQVTTRQVLLVLMAIWIVAVLLSTPLFCFFKIDSQKLYEHTFVQQCIDDWPDDRFREIYTTAVMLIQYLTPASTISYLHGRICRFLQNRHEERPGFETQMAEKTRNDLRRHRTNMVLLTAVALVFSLTWLPLTLLNITADLAHEVFQEGQYNLIHAISLLIAMSSSAINPIIYGWFNSNFKHAFVELLGFGHGEKSVDSVEKSKNKLPPSNPKDRSGSASNSDKKVPKDSPQIARAKVRPASFSSSSSSTGKVVKWTHAQCEVEQVRRPAAAVERDLDDKTSVTREIVQPHDKEQEQAPRETDSFLSKDQRASPTSYDSLSNK